MLVARPLNQLNLVSVRIQTFTAKFVTMHHTHFAICYIANPPRITTHPHELKDVFPGTPVTFTVRTIGTESLSYQWQWKPAGEGSNSREWQQCDVKRFPGANNSTLTISSVQKSHEGSFRCAISNCAGSETSKPANLSVGMNPCFIAFVWSTTLCSAFLCSSDSSMHSTQHLTIHWCMFN